MLASLLTFNLALAQDAPPPPIVGGEETTDYSPVGTLLAYADGYGGSSFCSGTLIAQDWVLTAAHCVEAAIGFDRKGWDILFCTGSSLYSQSGIDECEIAVDLIEHPSYNGQSLNADIGLVELSAGLRASGTYALNTDNPRTFQQWDPVTYVGWGITGDNRQDSGRKRTADIPYYDYDSQFVYTYDPENELNLCSGDSGGAGLMWDNGGWELVGVNSFVGSSQQNAPCSGTDAYAGATRVDAFYDWITSYVDVDENGNNGGDDTEDDPNDDTEDDTNNGGDDTGIGDTAEPEGNGGKKNNNGNGKTDEWGTCSSVPLRTSGFLGLVFLGAALAGRRRQ